MREDLEKINHFISRAEARKLIGNYNKLKNDIINPKYAGLQEKYGILPESEAFNDKAILSILAQPGCVGVRIHYGIKLTEEKDKTRENVPLLVAVLVGVDKEGKNMWAKPHTHQPSGDREEGRVAMASMSATSDEGFEDGVIDEDSQRCPPYGKSEPQP
jgi:hypothetical protein